MTYEPIPLMDDPDAGLAALVCPYNHVTRYPRSQTAPTVCPVCQRLGLNPTPPSP